MPGRLDGRRQPGASGHRQSGIRHTDKEGQINTGRVLSLRRLDIKDERWLRAMNAIGEAVQVVGSKSYIPSTSASARPTSTSRSPLILRGCEMQGLLDYEKWSTTTVAELLSQMADINAGSVRLVLGKDGKAAAAIVLMKARTPRPTSKRWMLKSVNSKPPAMCDRGLMRRRTDHFLTSKELTMINKT